MHKKVCLRISTGALPLFKTANVWKQPKMFIKRGTNGRIKLWGREKALKDILNGFKKKTEQDTIYDCISGKKTENVTFYSYFYRSLIIYKKRPERQQGVWNLKGDFLTSIVYMLFKNVFIYLL